MKKNKQNIVTLYVLEQVSKARWVPSDLTEAERRIHRIDQSSQPITASEPNEKL